MITHLHTLTLPNGRPLGSVSAIALSRVSTTTSLLVVGTHDECIHVLGITTADGQPQGCWTTVVDAVPTWIGVDAARGHVVHVGTDGLGLITLSAGQEMQRMPTAWVTDGHIMADGRVVLICDNGDEGVVPLLEIWRPDGQHRSSQDNPFDPTVPFTAITATPDGTQFLLGTSEGEVLGFGPAASWDTTLQVGASDWLGWLSDGQQPPLLIAAGIAGCVVTHRWDAAATRDHYRWAQGGLFDACLVPDRRLLLLSSGRDVQGFHIAPGGEITHAGTALQEQRGTITSIDATPDGKIVAIGGGDTDGAGFVHLYRCTI